MMFRFHVDPSSIPNMNIIPDKGTGFAFAFACLYKEQ